jgi:hypothetical protein
VRKIPVEITVNNNNFSITDKRGNTASLSVKDNFEKALNPDKAKDSIIKQLSRSSSEDIFTAEKINFEASEAAVPFIPLSEINNIRRTLFDKLEDIRKRRTSSDTSTNISDKPNGQSPYMPQTKEDTPLMITRYCILQEIGQCKNIRNVKTERTLYLENNGKRFSLKFNCNASPCGMEISIAH